MRAETAGTRDSSPDEAIRPWNCGISSVKGSSTPPCTTRRESSLSVKRCCTSICGVQTQRLPDHDSAGDSTVAYEVGDRGEKKGTSWPILTEFLAQSRWTVAVRRRMIPVAAPYSIGGMPPPKSTSALPEVSAPNNFGPRTSTPNTVCARVPPTPPAEAYEPPG